MDPITQATLAAKKPQALRTYLKKLGAVSVPEGVHIPDNAQEALLLGMSLARKTAYEDGMVDGVALGIEVMASSLTSGWATRADPS